MTRWHPDTCDGAAQGQGCILDIEDWGPTGGTPTGTVVQLCERHKALADAHVDNIFVSTVKNTAQTMPSLSSKLTMTVDGQDVLPASEVAVVFGANGTAVVTVKSASALDKLSLQTTLNTQFPGKAVVD